MDKKIKERWLSALRSGDYKQAKGVLHRVGGGFCCLGVLCDILEPNGWGTPEVATPEVKGVERSIRCHPHHGEHGDLPSSIQTRAGLNDAYPHIKILVEMNDAGKRFKSIAAYIESAL